jgi:hypothetical protein
MSEMDFTLELIQRSICHEYKVVSPEENRFYIITPFTFDDGDGYSIIVKRKDGDWVLTDEGHTFMELSYRIDLDLILDGPRKRILDRVLKIYKLSLDRGELSIQINPEIFGTRLAQFIQGVSRISVLSLWTPEQERSLFRKEVQAYLESVFPPNVIEKNYIVSQDSDRLYPIDYCVNIGDMPLYIFAISNKNQINDALICLMKHKGWKLKFHSVGVFDDEAEISRKDRDRFSYESDRQIFTTSQPQALLSLVSNQPPGIFS